MCIHMSIIIVYNFYVYFFYKATRITFIILNFNIIQLLKMS